MQFLAFLACTSLSETDVHIQLLEESKQVQCYWVSLQIAFMSYMTVSIEFTLCVLHPCFRKQYAVDCHSQWFGFLEWVACATFWLTESCILALKSKGLTHMLDRLVHN